MHGAPGGDVSLLLHTLGNNLGKSAVLLPVLPKSQLETSLRGRCPSSSLAVAGSVGLTLSGADGSPHPQPVESTPPG